MLLNKKYPVYTVLLILFFYIGPVFAQMPVRTGPASPEEIKKALTVVQANMDSLKAHKVYIYAMGLYSPLLAPQYNAWIKKYPKSVNIPLALGTVYHNAEMPQANEFLLKAAAIAPQNGKIWLMLSDDALTRGQTDAAKDFMKKAMLADTSNVNYAFGYLNCFANGDLNEYKQKVFDFVKRYPSDEMGAHALYQLAMKATNNNDKVSYLEELHKRYAPQKFSPSAEGMTVLTELYLQQDPEKALLLINEMADDENWKMRKQLAKALIQINKLEQEQNYKAAIMEADQAKLPRYSNLADFIVLKKAYLQEKAGNVNMAYDSLAAKFAVLPTDKLYTALRYYGDKMGKNQTQVDKDIETIRYKAAVAAYPFELGLYTSAGKLNLNDLKGKVVLLTFWFPGCGPCKAEFSHFEAVMSKFKNQNVVYVGINVLPRQDGYVNPLMKTAHYTFIPLRGNEEFAKNNYGVQSEPENFLIDKNGKIVFNNFRIDQSNHRTLELMIGSLL